MTEVEEKVNWNYYNCRKCRADGNAHMISEQAQLLLCDKCYRKYKRERAGTEGGGTA